MKLIKTSKVAELIGVCKKTARLRLIATGIKPQKIIRGKNGIAHYYYLESEIIKKLIQN